MTSLYDIQPGQPLTVSYGDPTNPTPLFAKFGFLPNDCATVFCKAVHLEQQIEELGYDYSGELLLLFLCMFCSFHVELSLTTSLLLHRANIHDLQTTILSATLHL